MGNISCPETLHQIRRDPGLFRNITLTIILTLTLVSMISCSGGGNTIVSPPQQAADISSDSSLRTSCLGFWQVAIDKEAGTIDAVDMRGSDLIINVLGFLEPPALKGLTIDFGTLKINDPVMEVDVIITHPIASAEFTGFDVRGVVFGPRVANADGLTVVTSPEFFNGVQFGYKDGLLGTPESTAHFTGLAGYKYFCDGLGLDNELATFMSNPLNLEKRGSFSAAPKKNMRRYVLDWTGAGQNFFVFNYAVYANYDWPVGDPPYDISDFNISTANSAEAFCCKFTELSNSLFYSAGVGGGNISLQAEIWDWQKDIVDVRVNETCPNITFPPDSFMNLVGPGATAYSNIYEILDLAGTPLAAGEADIIITVTDPVTFGNAWFLGLLPTSNPMYYEKLYNCFVHKVLIEECPKPTVESTDPPCGAGVLNDVVFNCTGLVDGPTLGVKFTKGASEWAGTDVHFISSTKMTADFNLNTATLGDELDITITNGCGTEGTGPAKWKVLYYIHVVGTPNVDITVAGRTPKDITIDPSSDTTAISYTTMWRRWTNNYTTSSTDYPCWGNRSFGNWDAVPGMIWYCHEYPPYTDQYLAWSWADFTGWQSGSSYWQPGEQNEMKDIANDQGGQWLIGLYHWKWNYIYNENNLISFIQCYIGYSFNYPAHCGVPFYYGTGNTGVVADNVKGIDLPQYSGSGKPDVYILEDMPSSDTGVVEKWHIDYSPTFLLAFGEGTFFDPLDITVDSNFNVYVLDKNSSGLPVIWAYNVEGKLIGTSFAMESAKISGSPLRMDGALSANPDEVHVLHSAGVTRFSMY